MRDPQIELELDSYDRIAMYMLAAVREVDKELRLNSEDPDDLLVTILRDTRQWLMARANVFKPPGMSKGGYPTGEKTAEVINLEAYLAQR